MTISERKQNAAIRWTSWMVSVLVSLFSASAYADNASWMEDHPGLFGDHTLETLSLPASHDAGMYEHDVELIEIGIADLRAYAGYDSLVPVNYPSRTGIVPGTELLSYVDTIESLLPYLDGMCMSHPLAGAACAAFVYAKLENTISGFVGEYIDLAKGLPGDLSITQNLDLYGQLSSGIRMFDLRPKKQAGDLYIHHSQGNIKKGGQGPKGKIDISFDLPCVGDPFGIVDGCVPPSGGPVDLGDVEWDFAGEVMSLSVTGPPLDEVLADVRSFMQEGHRELVVLEFSHYWRGYNGGNCTDSEKFTIEEVAACTPFDAADYDELIAMVEDQLGPWLLTEDMLPDGAGLTPEERLADATLSELIGAGGRVLAVFEKKDYAYSDPARGIWPNSVVSNGGRYSHKDDLGEMMNDQRNKFDCMPYVNGEEDEENSPCWEDETPAPDRFELSWTLTCPADDKDCSVEDLAAEANPHLTDFIDGLTIPNDNGNTINEIWADFVDDAAATEIAMRLNTPDPEEMVSCQASQLSDAAKLCKAVFACYGKLVKNKLKAPVEDHLKKCLDRADARFLRSFEQALAKSEILRSVDRTLAKWGLKDKYKWEIKDKYCGIESDPVDDSFITPIDLIFEEEAITEWDPQRKDENAYRASMLKESGALCSAALRADSKDVKKPNPQKWQLARAKARDKFESKMRRAAARAAKKGVSIGVIDPIHCMDAVEAVADDFSALSNGPYSGSSEGPIGKPGTPYVVP